MPLICTRLKVPLRGDCSLAWTAPTTPRGEYGHACDGTFLSETPRRLSRQSPPPHVTGLSLARAWSVDVRGLTEPSSRVLLSASAGVAGTVDGSRKEPLLDRWVGPAVVLIKAHHDLAAVLHVHRRLQTPAWSFNHPHARTDTANILITI